MMQTLKIIPLAGIPLINPSDDLPAVLLPALQTAQVQAGDVLVVTQKIISKAENRYVHLNDIRPSDAAQRLAKQCGKDAALVELILQQAERVIRCRPGVIIVKHKLGFVHANAGIDHSNIDQGGDGRRVLLLPVDPDNSAQRLRAGLAARLGLTLAVIINDSVGRAWRYGTNGIAIGAAGITCLLEQSGQRDLMGNMLVSTQTGIADEIAAAASLIMGQTDAGIPAALLRGLAVEKSSQTAAALRRRADEDLFL